MDNVDNFQSLKNNITKAIQLWSSLIDISDGKLLSDNGFLSNNFSIAWDSAEKKAYGDVEIEFIIWTIFKVLHKLARKKYEKGSFTVYVNEITTEDIEKAYREEKQHPGAPRNADPESNDIGA
ncbi:MAG: hypothetical protein FWG82_01840 [Oscillospiraceae bacterium]|nr:hypothetical protein [Oscillospiraceae bacterium]